MEPNVKKTVDCYAFRDWIPHFQADEVDDAQRQALQEHLDGCADCARRLELEDGFLRALKARLPRHVAPPGLETRVRAALDETASSEHVEWYRRPWFAAAAAAVLLAALILPGLGDPGYQPGPQGAVLIEGREVLVVDRECDRAGRSMDQQRRCTHPLHVNALKLAGGNYWNLAADEEAARQMLLDRDLRGSRLVVSGQYYPGLHTLHVTGYEVVGGHASLRGYATRPVAAVFRPRP